MIAEAEAELEKPLQTKNYSIFDIKPSTESRETRDSPVQRDRQVTGVTARVNMDSWQETMIKAIQRMKLEIYLFTKYIDDFNLALSLVPLG